MIALLFAVLAFAAPPKGATPLWTLEFARKQPMAAFFDVSSGALFVSLRGKGGESGTIARVSLQGKLENSSYATSKGPPGALRAYDGKIYWISGSQVQSKGEEGVLTEGLISPELGDPTDIAVDRHGAIYVGTKTGNLVRLKGGTTIAEWKGQPITGLFLLADTLQILRGTRLQGVPISASIDLQASSFAFCRKECRGLERTSAGKWLTVSGARVLEVNGEGLARTLYTAPGREVVLGRPAYVYQMDTNEDFYVVPFPSEGLIRAFRVNAAGK